MEFFISINFLSVIVGIVLIVKMNLLRKKISETICIAMLVGSSVFMCGISFMEKPLLKSYGYFPEFLVSMVIMVSNLVRFFNLSSSEEGSNYRQRFPIHRI